MQVNHSSELKQLQNYKEDVDPVAVDQPPAVPLDDLFEFLELGCNGEVEVAPRDLCKRLNTSGHARLSTLPNGLPPVFSSNHELQLEEYLIHPEKLPIHRFDKSQRFWPRKKNPHLLFNAAFSPVLTTLKVQRNLKTGDLLGYEEVGVLNADCTGKNSTSLLRHPDAQLSEVKGSSTNIPFRPGGLDTPSVINLVKEETTLLDFENDLLGIPPGFNQKVLFTSNINDDGLDTCESDVIKKNVISIADMLAGSVNFESELIEEDERKHLESQALHVKDEVDSSIKDSNQSTVELKKSESLEKLFVQNNDDSKIENGSESEISCEESVQDWAIMVNVKEPVKDFKNKVPEMAKTFPFELDTFQKQAVIHLENKECVFVAAHTSAGKTVVAEYAISLAHKHMTKAIYTSPIKALSNQKFRDFKKTFENVGLVTGDVQINPEASCLVMTTEILRSMLYRGSRVIRDTEWVIFDEVHYVNDAERGVVWEEVLIMLPDHVNIIMLSATVPNTREFAGWVGRIKKKKIYVISTTKRPVPLEYFLYTGNSSKTSNELFKVVDTSGKFLPFEYKKAVDAKNQRGKKSKDTYGPKGIRSTTSPNEEKNIWISIIRKLEKSDPSGLPMVAFTFSRSRCNENAERLSGLDMTTSKEKHRIHVFIQECITKLKDQDAKLPQVKRMQELLKRGLAVHHSGILPILKEMIEMLFQRGLVKVLFATETFAMGVNMPARTVIFDSIRKHDGENFRDLLPGEYIQMAGRAGRRGLDDTGTVIILCKVDVPECSDLRNMMLGKPSILQSRFRLTYSMILNLLRTGELRVEDMMKRSFAEFYLLKSAPEREKMIKEKNEQLESLITLTCAKCECDIEGYYNDCKDLMKLRKSLQLAIVFSSSGQKSLSCGRVIVINNNKDYVNTFGIVLSKKPLYSSVDSPVVPHLKNTYSVLIICNATHVVWSETSRNNDDESVELVVERYSKNLEINCPERPCTHKIINIGEDDIAEITEEKINVKSEVIMNDYNKRQQDRFRNDLPGASVTFATEGLLRLIECNRQGLPMLDLAIKDIKFKEERTHHKMLASRLEYYVCVGCLCFEEHFAKYREERILRDQLKNLQEKSSIEMLALIPEYRCRINLLVKLGYLNTNEVVNMKGRVACEISNHEIVISSLLLDKFFNDLEPAEIVALLSCFVFDQRKCREPNLTENLLKGTKKIKQTAERIAMSENSCGIDTSFDGFQFGLVEVVFEWARGMPFYEITQLTDVQEGIIVRCIQRLNELCHDVKNAAKQVGVAAVESKMELASSLLKRDIVFAASLYTQ